MGGVWGLAAERMLRQLVIANSLTCISCAPVGWFFPHSSQRMYYYDDDDDGTDSYHPSFYYSTNADTTSSQRIIEGTSMSEAKKRVDKATNKCCLLENTPESDHVEYAHCLPRSTKGPMASSFFFLISHSNVQQEALTFSSTGSRPPGT